MLLKSPCSQYQMHFYSEECQRILGHVVVHYKPLLDKAVHEDVSMPYLSHCSHDWSELNLGNSLGK